MVGKEKQLKGKKMNVWHRGSHSGDQREVHGSWVLGEDPKQLDKEDASEGVKVSFTSAGWDCRTTAVTCREYSSRIYQYHHAFYSSRLAG